jgi:hypothetical protein
MARCHGRWSAMRDDYRLCSLGMIFNHEKHENFFAFVRVFRGSFFFRERVTHHPPPGASGNDSP